MRCLGARKSTRSSLMWAQPVHHNYSQTLIDGAVDRKVVTILSDVLAYQKRLVPSSALIVPLYMLEVVSSGLLICEWVGHVSINSSVDDISKTWFSHVDRRSASANIIVYHSYTPNLARCPSAPQRSTALCGCKLMLHSTTETCAVTIGCYRGLHFLGSPHRESNYKYARFQ